MTRAPHRGARSSRGGGYQLHRELQGESCRYQPDLPGVLSPTAYFEKCQSGVLTQRVTTSGTVVCGIHRLSAGLYQKVTRFSRWIPGMPEQSVRSVTGTRNLFAEGGEIVMSHSSSLLSGMSIVMVAVPRMARGGTSTVNRPAVTLPPWAPSMTALPDSLTGSALTGTGSTATGPLGSPSLAPVVASAGSGTGISGVWGGSGTGIRMMR